MALKRSVEAAVVAHLPQEHHVDASAADGFAEAREGVRIDRLADSVGVLRQGMKQRHGKTRAEKTLAPERQKRDRLSVAAEDCDQRFGALRLHHAGSGFYEIDPVECAEPASLSAHAPPERAKPRDGPEAGYELDIVHDVKGDLFNTAGWAPGGDSNYPGQALGLR